MTSLPRMHAMLRTLLIVGMFTTMPLHAEEPLPRAQDLKNPPPTPPELKQNTKPKEPINESVPNKPVRSLILTVKLALLSDPRTAPSTIEVDTKGQDIVLSGKVAGEEQKLAAAEIARQVDGVKTVVNKLEVVSELHQVTLQKRDQAITEYVKERFKKSATLEAARFDIKTENGIVELSGKVRFQVIVLEAAEAARQIPGVKAVKTHMVRIEGTE